MTTQDPARTDVLAKSTILLTIEVSESVVSDHHEKLKRQFYSRHDSTESLLDLAQALSENGMSLYGALFSPEASVDSILELLRSTRAIRWGFTLREGSPSLITLIDKDTSSGELTFRRMKAFLWKDPRHPVMHLLSCQQKDDFDYMRMVLHRFLLPNLSKVFLRTTEVSDALNKLARTTHGIVLRVREYVVRSLIDDPESLKEVRTNRQWTDEDYATVFANLARDRYWLYSLKIEIRGTGTAIGRIWRDAAFMCESGFGYFNQTIINSLQQAVMRSKGFFEKRDQLTSPTGKSRPVRIVYSQDVFADKRQNHRLIDTLHGLPDSSLSVLHPNPYMHASLVDYADGSSYEIWVTTPSSILIVPKRKATTESIERLCDCICDQFEEGDIAELEVS